MKTKICTIFDAIKELEQLIEVLQAEMTTCKTHNQPAIAQIVEARAKVIDMRCSLHYANILFMVGDQSGAEEEIDAIVAGL